MPPLYEIYPVRDTRKDYVPMSYHEDPEGEQCFKKMAIMGGCGALLGPIQMFHYAWTHEMWGVGPFTRLVMYSAGPYIAAGVTFAAVQCACSRIRQKESLANYFIGGLAAGSIMGLKYRSVNSGLRCMLLFSVLGFAFGAGHKARLSLVPNRGFFDTGPLYPNEQ